jgi:hypothetical protein
MNAKAARALYTAARRGVPQIKGTMIDGRARCAAQVLDDAGLAMELWETNISAECPLCGSKTASWGSGKTPITNELILVAHFNDDHAMSFASIARKLGPDNV